MVLAGAFVWGKPPDDTHPHGHERLESIITAVIAGALFIVACEILYHAITQSPSTGTPGLSAAIAAGVSVITKEILYQFTIRGAKKSGSQALIANAWHHRSDAISSIPALAAILLSRINPAFADADRYGAAIVSVFLMFTAYKIATPAFRILMDAGAPVELVDCIIQCAESVEHVKEVHHVRTRYLSPDKLIVDMHVLVDGELPLLTAHQTAERVESILKDTHGVFEITVHLEPYDSEHRMR
jgi:cation diffusion facilitator family transporter